MIDVIAGLLVGLPLSIRLMLMFNVCVIYRACVYLRLRESTTCAHMCFCLCSAVSRQFVSSTPTAESVQSVQVALYSDILTSVLQRHFLCDGRRNRRDTAFTHTHHTLFALFAYEAHLTLIFLFRILMLCH